MGSLGGEFDSPFSVIDEVLSNIYIDKKPIIVDFHAEAASEKAALGWYLDGRVTAVVGTHTHVPTTDCKILQMELHLYQTLVWWGLKTQF